MSILRLAFPFALLAMLTACKSRDFSFSPANNLPDSDPTVDEIVAFPPCLVDAPLAVLDTSTVSDELEIWDDLVLQTVCYPTLVTINNYIDIGYNTALTTINLPELTTVTNDGLYIYNNTLLKAVNLPALVTADIPDGFYINDNPALKNINLGDNLNATFLNFESNALTRTNVDTILAKLDNAGYSNGTLLLFGISNATPSAAGLISKANLVARGWQFPINLVAYGSSLTSFSYPQYTSVNSVGIGGYEERRNLLLTSVNLSAVTTVANAISVIQNPLLTTIQINPSVDAASYDFSQNALTQSSVDHILTSLDAGGLNNKTLNLWRLLNTDIESNALPSAAGLTAIDNLIAKGWIIKSEIQLNGPDLTSFTLPSYPPSVQVSNINMNSNTALVTADFTGMVSVDSADMRYNPLVTNINLSTLQTVTGTLNIQSDSLVTLDLSSLTSVTDLIVRDNGILTDITINPNLNCLAFQFYDNALSQATVDDILAKVDGKGLLNGYLHLNNGANSGPTGGDANPNVVNLRAKGWNVQINP